MLLRCWPRLTPQRAGRTGCSDDRAAAPDDAAARFEQGEVQVAVLAPGGGEALVEAADRPSASRRRSSWR